MEYYGRTCKVCNKNIDDLRIDAIYCSDKCRMRVNRIAKRQALVNEIVDLSRTIPNYSEQVGDFVIRVLIYCPKQKKHHFLAPQELKKLPINQLKDQIRSLKLLNFGRNMGSIVSMIKKGKK